MTEEEMKALKKEVAKKKRIASEHASQLHDLVEDRLPGAFEELPGVSQATYDACKAWWEAEQNLKAAQNA